MGFFDKYVEAGGSYITTAEKQVIMENGIPFKVVSIAYEEAGKFGPRYIANVLVPDPATGDEEERALTFPVGSGVASRDRMLSEMRDYLTNNPGESVAVKLEKKGKSILVRPA